jgi:hypothetical protein
LVLSPPLCQLLFDLSELLFMILAQFIPNLELVKMVNLKFSNLLAVLGLCLPKLVLELVLGIIKLRP